MTFATGLPARRAGDCSLPSRRRRGARTNGAGARRYEPGDDARRIDWSLTARSLDPHVRTTEAEFDVLPSGYVQASLLKEGKKLTLDEPAKEAASPSDSVISGGKETDIALDFSQTSAQTKTISQEITSVFHGSSSSRIGGPNCP